MPGLVLPRQRVCLCNKRIQFFDAIHRAPAGTSMATAVITLRQPVDRHETGAQPHPDGAVRRVNESQLADAALDGVQIADGGAGVFKGQAKLFLIFPVDPQPDHAVFRTVKLIVDPCLKAEGFEIPQIQPGVQPLRIHACVHQERGPAQSIPVHPRETKAPGICHHAQIQE